MPPTARSTAIPCLRYRDAHAAIDWLGRVLGLTARLVVPNEHGGVAHAQLARDGGMVLLGSVNADNAYGRHMKQPDELGGFQTQTTHLVVDDPDNLHADAVAAGATIVMPLRDEPFGGRSFCCVDPEGHLWSIGSYDPWA